MKKRLFVAVDLPSSFASAFNAYKETLKLPELRWTREKNYHLTIAFLGYVDETHLDEIKKVLSSVASQNKLFKLNFENVTFAPPNITPRMIWAKFSLNESYSKLVDEIFNNLESYITEQNRAEKIPHITLARFAENSQFEKQTLPQPNLENRFLEIEGFSLLESEPTKEGSNYLQISQFHFGG